MIDLARIRSQAEQRLPVTGKDVIALLDLIDKLNADNEILTVGFSHELRGIVAMIEGGPHNARAA
ncbi:hypothetical protein [Roseibium algae]|uniref:Uncharacterized protein n=1 Tax=Roseibium algae TaxID=3123038 RepID=A0ABU8TR91_9HYPH